MIRTEGTTRGMPYSNDLRLRVLAAVDDGVPVRQVVTLLRVSVSYIDKALIRRRRTGETAARMPCGRPPRKLAGHEQAVLTRLGAISTGGGPNEGMDAPPPSDQS